MDSEYREALLVIKPLIHVLMSFFMSFEEFEVPLLSIVHTEYVLFS